MEKAIYLLRRFCRLGAITGTFLLLTGISGCSPQSQGVPPDATTDASSREQEPGDSGTRKEVPANAGFDTPEDAVTSYLVGLKSKNLAQMVDSFDIEKSIANTLNLGLPNSETALLEKEVLIPAADIFKNTAIENRKNEITNTILRQYVTLSKMDINAGLIQLKQDDDQSQFIEKLTKQYRATDFSTLKFLGFIPPNTLSEDYASDLNHKTLAAMAGNYGVDQLDSRAAVIDIGGQLNILVFELVNYDGRWYNSKLGGLLSNMMQLDQDSEGVMTLSAKDGKRLKKEMAKNNLLSDTPIASPSPAPVMYESEGYDSPEKAAASYLEGLKSSNYDQIISTFAIKSYVKHYDFPEQIALLKAYSFMNQEFNLPVVDDFTADLSIQNCKNTLANEISDQITSICYINGDYFGNHPLPNTVSNQADYLAAMVTMVDDTDFSTLKILGFIPPDALSDVYESEGNRNYRDGHAKLWGADEQKCCAIAFELEGNKYLLCTDAVSYQGKWYNKAPGGLLSILMNLGSSGISPIDAQSRPELEALIQPIE